MEKLKVDFEDLSPRVQLLIGFSFGLAIIDLAINIINILK